MTECHGLQHLGCENDLTFHSSCMHTHVLVNMQMYRNYLLKIHNKYREDVAAGTIIGLPMASHMPELKWHSKLALIAEYHVKRCLQSMFRYCMAVTNFPDPAVNYGSNLLDTQSLPSYTPSPNSEKLTAQVEQWTHQVYKLAQGHLFGNEVHEIRNILNDENQFVGCAAADYSDRAASRFVLICYYNNRIEAMAPIYKKGTFADKNCPHGISEDYPKLCKMLTDISD
ncbi:GH14938 [Drosophila grimshawi]|uniref:GH14938 n=2 Tax=Drosophila grimshawi TaxID=7222 RepID=B4J1M9_DROGR|nr:GH14938 [Drosophila grimshawi]